MTCRTGIMIIMMLVVFVCFWLCYMGLQYGDCPLMGGGTGESFESCDSVTVGRSGTRTSRK